LVVISSCGHAGIVNTVKAAQAASGVEKVQAVIGGFHLAPSPEPYIVQTVDALKTINPDYLVPCIAAAERSRASPMPPCQERCSRRPLGPGFIFGA
jgi:7,8-dihydropterin-6-yl-methyl-4-(beta-D-ribofuranosyl)aminobenzene 5'-phosphate synthase